MQIVIAVITYKRTTGLKLLLNTLVKLPAPEGSFVQIVVVDNDETRSAEETVKMFQVRGTHHKTTYLVEEKKGIPFARNRALREAYLIGAQFLCFIDDDEEPDRSWLIKLSNFQAQTKFALVGGPSVVKSYDDGPLNLWQRVIHRSLYEQSLYSSRQISFRSAKGEPVVIYTNNWMCDLRKIQRSQLLFDESMVDTGGSDTKFFHSVLLSGLSTGWCSTAIVYERILPTRLCASYQIHLGMHRSINHFRFKYKTRSLITILRVVISSTHKAIVGLFLLAVPVLGFRSLVVGLQQIGWALGRIQAVAGANSSLYKVTRNSSG